VPKNNTARGTFPDANLVRRPFFAGGEKMTIRRKGDGFEGALVAVEGSARRAGFGIENRKHVFHAMQVPTEHQRFAVRVNGYFANAITSLPADFFPRGCIPEHHPVTMARDKAL